MNYVEVSEELYDRFQKNGYLGYPCKISRVALQDAGLSYDIPPKVLGYTVHEPSSNLHYYVWDEIVEDMKFIPVTEKMYKEFKASNNLYREHLNNVIWLSKETDILGFTQDDEFFMRMDCIRNFMEGRGK